MEKQPYQLICSYVKNEYFVSTAYRRASTIEPMWYFETIIWEWNHETQKRGKMLEMEDSGVSEHSALRNHFGMIGNLNNL